MAVIVAVLAILLPQAKEDEAKQALDKFKTAYAAKDAAARAAAVGELAKTDHEKVILRLAQVLVTDEPDVRIAAAQGLAVPRDSKDNLKKAVNALSKAFAINAAGSQKRTAVAIVEALEKIQEGLGMTVLHQNCASPQIPVAEGSINAAGELARKASVPVLIQLAAKLEADGRKAGNVGPNGKTTTGGGLPYVGGDGVDVEAPKRARTLIPVIYRVLEAVTRQELKTVKAWQEWWAANGDSFMK